MAANIDLSNDRVNFAYVAEHGSVWHGTGQVVPLKSSLDVWKKESGLDWVANKSHITFANSQGETDVFPKKKALYRSDNNAPLSVVGSNYNIVQPGEIVDFFSDLLDGHDMEMSSCGSLFEGRRFFATAKLNDIEIIPGDKITGYLLIATSLDGSLATVAKTTSVRTVCSNTLTMAVGEKSANVIKVPHSTSFDASKAKLDLGLIEESQYTFIENMRKLASVSISDKDAFAFYKEMFYSKEVSAEDQHGTIVNRVDDIMSRFKNGAGAEYGRNTLYNVLQGATDYYSNNIKSRTDSAQFWSSFYGAAENTKLSIQSKLLDLV